MTQKSLAPSDAELEDARDNWSTEIWDAFHTDSGREAAGRARYAKYNPAGSATKGIPHNDIIKRALKIVSKGRCWWQGTSVCKSRAILPGEAQIDHIVPKTATGAELRKALGLVRSQDKYFDVHDPSNLAYICGPCNTAKGDEWPEAPAMQAEVRRGDKRRGRVIRLVNKWCSDSNLGELLLGVKTIDVSDADIRGLCSEVAAELILKLAERSGGNASLEGFQEVCVEQGDYKFSVGPSFEVLDDYAQEMYFEDHLLEARLAKSEK